MTIERMDHVGIVVEDLPAAIEFFLELGMELQGEGSGEGNLVDRIVGLKDVRSDFAFLQTPDGHGKVELVKFNSPPATDGNPQAPVHATGLRHLTFAVDDIKAALAKLEARGAELIGELVLYEDIYWLCYVRGPEGIIVELAEKIG